MVPDDEDAPLWFLEEDRKHWAPAPPFLAREKHAMRAAIDPNIEQKQMKKVLEAKMRRKKRLTKKLDKIKKKAENLDENDGDMNARVLNAGLKRVQSEWGKAKRSAKGAEKKYVVVGKGRSANLGRASKKQVRRVKTKLVDARMKKDKRNEKMKEKQNKGKSLKRKRN